MVFLIIFIVGIFLRIFFCNTKSLHPSNNTSIYAYFLKISPLHFKEAIFSPRKKHNTLFRKSLVFSIIFCYTKKLHLFKIKRIYTLIIALISPRIDCKSDAQLQSKLPTMAHKNTCLCRQSAITPRVNSPANFR